VVFGHSFLHKKAPSTGALLNNGGGWEPVFTQVYIYVYSINFINKIIQKNKK